MLIGFTSKTSKLLPKILCKKFRHCAVVFHANEINNNRAAGTAEYIMIQIAGDGVRLIAINRAGMALLRASGWVFVETGATCVRTRIPNMLSCVGMAKRATGINNPFIWTPDQLYKYLNKKPL